MTRDHLQVNPRRKPLHTTCIVVYHQEYDAFFCLGHGVWTEEVCGDKDCEFCKNRPENP